MNWDKLYSMQQQLDQYIEDNHQLKDLDVFQEKYLALLVEIGELANETRCFKFWSSKPGSDKHIILEEYVDGIHFILSLGLEKGYRYAGSGNLEPATSSQTQMFNEVFSSCVSFKNNTTKSNYDNLFTTYLQLGNLLGFQEEDVQHAYFKKNEINYERQDQGY